MYGHARLAVLNGHIPIAKNFTVCKRVSLQVNFLARSEKQIRNVFALLHAIRGNVDSTPISLEGLLLSLFIQLRNESNDIRFRQ